MAVRFVEAIRHIKMLENSCSVSKREGRRIVESGEQNGRLGDKVELPCRSRIRIDFVQQTAVSYVHVAIAPRCPICFRTLQFSHFLHSEKLPG